MISQLLPPQNLDRYIEGSNEAIRNADYVLSPGHHRSSQDNRMFRALGQVNTWNLSASGADPLEKLKIIIDQLNTLPPVMGYYRRIYNKCDTADLFVQEVAHRSQVILNCAYPTLDLHWQRE
jgi:hypothetical protein